MHFPPPSITSLQKKGRRAFPDQPASTSITLSTSPKKRHLRSICVCGPNMSMWAPDTPTYPFSLNRLQATFRRHKGRLMQPNTRQHRVIKAALEDVERRKGKSFRPED